MTRHHEVRRRAAALAGLLFLAAYGDGPTISEPGTGQTRAAGFQETVQVDLARPSTGNQALIHSEAIYEARGHGSSRIASAGWIWRAS